MASITRYNAKEYTVMVGDVCITGFGENLATGEKDEDFYEPSVGCQGDVIVNENNNPLGTVTIKVQATCPQKSYLMSLAGSTDFTSIWVTSKTMNERFGGSKAKIKSFPSLERTATANDMEFMFGVFDYTVEPIE